MDATGFETERARLTAVATRILGASAEADDVVQEAWLRLDQAEGSMTRLPG
ncbi:sigma factor [Luteimicrobium album]|uniref:sigma factor n=1 Tax=Luteimicrobium album TaxID=1054550 RepID=UPI0024E192EB|nr:sigma factor [Luteimicrobium album]